jgi:hypothetical protein
MTLTSARLQVEGLEVVPQDAPSLQAEWEGVLGELSGFTAEVEPLGLGRVLLTLEPSEAQQLAQAHQARVGVAATREPAVLAALAAFEGRTRLLKSGSEQAFMRALPARFLRGLGVSQDAITRLHFLGVDHAGDLLSWRPPQLEAFLGKEARLLLPYLYGPWSDRIANYQAPAKVEVTYHFEEPASEPHEVTPILELLAKRAADRLGERRAGRLTVTVTTQGLRFQASRLAKEALSTPGSIRRLASLALGDTRAQTLGLESLTLTLSGLVRPSIQEGLWQAREERARAIALVTARFPGALLAFREVDPFALTRDRRFVKQRLGSLELIPEVAVREEEQDAPSPAQRTRYEQSTGQPTSAGMAKAGV